MEKSRLYSSRPKLPISYDRPDDLYWRIKNQKSERKVSLTESELKKFNKMLGVLHKIHTKETRPKDIAHRAFEQLSLRHPQLTSKEIEVKMRVEIALQDEAREIREKNRESATRLAYQTLLYILNENKTWTPEKKQITQTVAQPLAKDRDLDDADLDDLIHVGGGAFAFGRDGRPIKLGVKEKA
jgi:hypothetical protein